MSIFGCRNYPDGTTGLPDRSPLGNQQYVVRATTVFESGDDYLIPLKGIGEDGRLVKQLTGYTDNWYFEFMYLKENEIAAIKPWVDIDWVSQWKLRNHPYVRLVGDDLEYPLTMNNHRVWYQMLVPYRIPFTATTLLSQNGVRDSKRWMCGKRQVTEPKTLQIVIYLMRSFREGLVSNVSSI